MTDDVDTIDPTTLDPHTLREVKRLVESYPVVSHSQTELDDYREGKRDGFTTVAAVISQWLDETGDD